MATRSLLTKLARFSISSSSSFGNRRIVDANRSFTLQPLTASKRFFSTDDKKPKGRKGVKVVVDEDFHEEDVLPPDVAEDVVSAEDTWDDPFGLNYEDGEGRIGPEKELPPIYERDATTGRLTGVIKKELTEEEKRILKADPIDQEKWLLKSLEKHWQQSGTDEIGIPVELNKLGERIRKTNLGLNVLGRSPRSTGTSSHSSDIEQSFNESFSKPLSGSEFKAFSKFMKKEFKLDIDEDHIPTASSGPQKRKDDELDPDEQELALKWLTARAQRQMDDFLDDNPYSDLMPGDLSPSRLVNRKRAKQIPVNVLHHNNIPLLQRFLNPTGQIKHRIQTRLGARDQRRVAKLVKRARSLGLLPYVGQQKVETHGWIHEKDLGEDREWEKELKRRGLVIEKRTEPQSDI
jgi:small subunit ribosomal protein S18